MRVGCVHVWVMMVVWCAKWIWPKNLWLDSVRGVVKEIFSRVVKDDAHSVLSLGWRRVDGFWENCASQFLYIAFTDLQLTVGNENNLKHTRPNTRTEPWESQELWMVLRDKKSKISFKLKSVNNPVAWAVLECTTHLRTFLSLLLVKFSKVSPLELKLFNYSSLAHFLHPITCRIKRTQACIRLFSYFITNNHAIIILTSTINTTKQKTSASWWRFTCTSVKSINIFRTISSGSWQLIWCTRCRKVADSKWSNWSIWGPCHPLRLHDASGSSVRKGSSRRLRIFTTTDASGSGPNLYHSWWISGTTSFASHRMGIQDKQANLATRSTESAPLVRFSIPINQSSSYFLASHTHSHVDGSANPL